MLEVLVAIVIFSFGILELVRLQTAMTRAQGSAKFRADAVHLAEDAVALLLTDKPNLAKYDADLCATHPRCAEWVARVTRTIPQGDGSIEVGSAGAVKVTVTWSLNAEGKHNHVLETVVGF